MILQMSLIVYLNAQLNSLGDIEIAIKATMIRMGVNSTEVGPYFFLLTVLVKAMITT